jgi:hypothetical protein
MTQHKPDPVELVGIAIHELAGAVAVVLIISCIALWAAIGSHAL